MFTSLGSIRYLRVRGKDAVMFMYSHAFDVALCGIKVKHVARSLSLDGHP